MDIIEVSVSKTGALVDKRKRRLIYVALFVCLIALLGASRTKWLPLLYSFLDVSQDPQQADYIIVLGGWASSRLPTAISLYKDGYAQEILISCNGSRTEEIIESFEAARMSSRSAKIINAGCRNTWEEANAILDFLESENVDSALIVTNAWHTRRAATTYRSLKDNKELTLTFVAAEDFFPRNRWWQEELGRVLIEREYLSLIYYLFRYRVVPF